PQGAASFGWFAYAPLSDTTFSPGLGGDLWVFGLALQGFGTILGSVNFITTILCMRMPGMTMFRMPIFTWNALITGVLVLMAFPPGLRAAGTGSGSTLRCEHLRCGQRRSGAVAAPVLVLRSPRGVRARAAVLRHRHRDHPGLLAQADLRLQDAGRRDDLDRGAVRDRLGAPHVHHRRGDAGLLRLHDDAHRRPDGREVLQLGRDHVAGLAHLR